ncbi:MAG: hypothetical protein FJW21_13145 [Acidimicrobiia bacterium]|nr:hypothetical protein [Acidimicrobiia bacterium]
MELYGVLLVAIVAAEVAMRVGLRLLAKQDGLIAFDEVPTITPAALDRFFDHGFDPELGWIRKPNTRKKDMGRFAYSIDARGSRVNPGHEHLPVGVVTVGDSYTFCREVEDADTWQWGLAERLQTNVLNFGVGNYGFDQALLRLEREFPTAPAPIVVMGVVPSTIARILSVWKHYNEYGNFFAFKPRYVLEHGALRLRPTPVTSRNDFFRLAEILPGVQAHDEFYRTRFLREAFRAPYLLSAMRNWRRLALAPAKAARRIGPRLGLDEAPFAALVTALDSGGAGQTARLFAEPGPAALLDALVGEFVAMGQRLGFTPVLLIMPMKDDLYLMQRRGHFYRNFVDRAARRLPVVDAADALLASGNVRALFREWHYNPAGNARVAQLLADRLSTLNLRDRL